MGGGSSQTTQVSYQYDPQTSAAMVDLAGKELGMSEDQWNLYKQTFQPYIEQMVQANQSILPSATAASIATQNKIVSDLQANQPVENALRNAQLTTLEAATPVAKEFYNQALNGVNVNQRVGQAASDVNQAFSNNMSETVRNLGRLGINGGSFGGMTAQDIKSAGIEKAKALAGAETAARINANEENFQRLGAAMGVSNYGAGLPGTQSLAGNSQTQYGGFTLANPANASMAGISSTGGILQPMLITGQTNTTKVNTSPWDFAGQILGNVTGAFSSGAGNAAGARLFAQPTNKS